MHRRRRCDQACAQVRGGRGLSADALHGWFRPSDAHSNLLEVTYIQQAGSTFLQYVQSNHTLILRVHTHTHTLPDATLVTHNPPFITLPPSVTFPLSPGYSSHITFSRRSRILMCVCTNTHTHTHAIIPPPCCVQLPDAAD